MKNTTGIDPKEFKNLRLSRKAVSVIKANHWTDAQVTETFRSPKAFYASRTHEGQYRVAGTDIVLVGLPMNDETFFVVTCFRNGSRAPKKAA